MRDDSIHVKRQKEGNNRTAKAELLLLLGASRKTQMPPLLARISWEPQNLQESDIPKSRYILERSCKQEVRWKPTSKAALPFLSVLSLGQCQISDQAKHELNCLEGVAEISCNTMLPSPAKGRNKSCIQHLGPSPLLPGYPRAQKSQNLVQWVISRHPE